MPDRTTVRAMSSAQDTKAQADGPSAAQAAEKGRSFMRGPPGMRRRGQCHRHAGAGVTRQAEAQTHTHTARGERSRLAE